MKTIYNTYVVMESQEQCDRMKQLCIDNGLCVLGGSGFELEKIFPHFGYYKTYFGIFDLSHYQYKITEQEFIELLKNTKQ